MTDDPERDHELSDVLHQPLPGEPEEATPEFLEEAKRQYRAQKIKMGLDPGPRCGNG